MEDKHNKFLTIQNIGKRFEWSSSIFSKLFCSLCMVLFTAMLSYNAVAQQTTITGTVTDANDETGLPGVNIVIPGTTVGTTTDFDGNYSLNVSSDADSLRFSFIGYITQVVPINNRTTINIALLPDTQMLEDVVVVGYGTQQRSQVTGSLTSVKQEDFVKGAINDPDELLQGKVPGLVISNQGSNPNSDSDIRLRGISSFGEDQEPLVVIDGIIGGNLDNLDPNDIENIDVLKDASASAIYGTRGSAGVILVTTKKGSSTGKTQISYNAYITGDFIEKEFDILSPQEFRDLAKDLGKSINDLGGNTDWQDEITQTGLRNVHSLAISGGDQTTTYRISGNFRDVDGIQEETGFQRINGRVNLTHQALNDNLTVNFNISVSDREKDLGNNTAFEQGVTFNPTAPVRGADVPQQIEDQDGNLVPNPNFREDQFANTGGFTEIGTFRAFNPEAIIRTSDEFEEEKNFNGAVSADYDFSDIIPGLSAKVFYSFETINNIRSLEARTTNKFIGGATASNLGPGLAEQQVFDNSDELVEGTVSYVNDFNNLHVDIVSGYSWNNIIDEGSFIQGGDFVADAVGVNNFSFAQDFDQGEGTVSSFKEESKLVGGFGRVSLAWDDTYFLNGSARREGSSRFGENEKWGNFYAIGGGIEVTELLDIPYVNSLRFRASYGVTGNNAPEVGIAQQRFAPTSNFFANGRFIQSFGPVSNQNPDLKWEEKHEFNVGVDFSVWNNRITGSVTHYDQDVQDLIFPVQVPVPPNLFPTTFKNIGELETEGQEISLTVNAINTDRWSWNSTVTSTKFGDTELTDFVSADELFISNAGSPGLNDTQLIRVKQGASIGDIWGPRFSRFANDGEDVNGDGTSNTGGFVCVDPQGEEFLCIETNRQREQVLGNGLPGYQVGWTNNVNYNNFDFSLFVRGVFGHSLANMNKLFNEPLGRLGDANLLASAKNLPARSKDVQPQFTSRVVEDAGFVRIQNLTLGYTLPFFDDNSQIRRLRVYFSGNNIATFTGFDGVDPTPNFVDRGTDAGALAPGIARRDQWFTARSFTLGINLDF